MNKNQNTTQQGLQRKSMKIQAEEMEIKARYWKAVWEVRKYTLDADSIQVDYEAYIEREREKGLKALEELKAQSEQYKGQLQVEDKSSGPETSNVINTPEKEPLTV